MKLQECGRTGGTPEGKPNSLACKYQEKDTPLVQLEIQVGALRRLIIRNSLVIEELHCLNVQSKSLIRQALLDSLVEPVG